MRDGKWGRKRLQGGRKRGGRRVMNRGQGRKVRRGRKRSINKGKHEVKRREIDDRKTRREKRKKRK